VRRHNYDNVGNRKSGIHVKVLNSFLLNKSNFRKIKTERSGVDCTLAVFTI